MQKEERKKYIMDELKTFDKVRSIELSDKLNVSRDTIRRDLKELADKGRLKQVHGGAMSSSIFSFQEAHIDKYVHNGTIKIVRKALPLIKDNMVFIIDGGTTGLELAKVLPLDLKATVCTNALKVALVLCDHPGIEVCFFGGRLHKGSRSTMGLDVIDRLSGIYADMFFMDAIVLNAPIGITADDREGAIIKRFMMTRSNKVVMLI